MAQIGIDCEIMLDNQGYFVKPGTYRMKQPRVRKATVRADNGESYVDLGPGKRTWSMVLLCYNDLLKYDGTPTAQTGQQYRDALRASYAQIGVSINYIDPLNSAPVSVHFDSYAETCLDLHSQQIPLATGNASGLSYEVAIELVEA